MCTNSCSPLLTKTYVPRTARARPRCCRRVRAHYPRTRPEVRTASDTERMRAVGRDFAQVHSGRFFTRVHASFFGHGSKLCCEMCSTGHKKKRKRASPDSCIPHSQDSGGALFVIVCVSVVESALHIPRAQDSRDAACPIPRANLCSGTLCLFTRQQGRFVCKCLCVCG